MSAGVYRGPSSAAFGTLIGFLTLGGFLASECLNFVRAHTKKRSEQNAMSQYPKYFAARS